MDRTAPAPSDEAFVRDTSGRTRLMFLSSSLAVLAAVLAWTTLGARSVAPTRASGPVPGPRGREASHEAVERTCGACHSLPSPELFPRDLWAHEVHRGFTFLERGTVPPD